MVLPTFVYYNAKRVEQCEKYYSIIVLRVLCLNFHKKIVARDHKKKKLPTRLRGNQKLDRWHVRETAGHSSTVAFNQLVGADLKLWVREYRLDETLLRFLRCSHCTW